MVGNEFVAARLDGEDLKKFRAIKAFLGLKADAEVVRFLINDFWRHKIAKEAKSLIDSDSDVEIFDKEVV